MRGCRVGGGDQLRVERIGDIDVPFPFVLGLNASYVCCAIEHCKWCSRQYEQGPFESSGTSHLRFRDLLLVVKRAAGK